MADSVESTELMDEQLAAARRKAQRLEQNLKRARDLHHFSKASKTNLLKAFEEVPVGAFSSRIFALEHRVYHHP